MNKLEYIVKTLSRTKRKDYENYVINRIYNELNDLTIIPVTQQYVRRKGSNSYALIDLYFPQLNIGIEIDEEHHRKKYGADKLRFYDIATAISDYSEIRIKIYDDYENKTLRDISLVNKDISRVVDKIRNKKIELASSFKQWDGKPDIYKAIAKKSITLSDNYNFNQEEVRNFFGREGTTQQCYYNLSKGKGKIPYIENGLGIDYFLWLPGLTIEDNNNNYIPYSKKLRFINIISNDGKYIYELIPNNKEINNEKIYRIVFLKMKDPLLNKQVYKFSGVFKMHDKTIKKEINGKEEIFVVHERVSESILVK